MTNEPDKSGKKDIAPRYSDPFSALRAEVDSLFDSFMGGSQLSLACLAPAAAEVLRSPHIWT